MKEQRYAGVVSTAAVSREAIVPEALAVFATVTAYIWKLRFAQQPVAEVLNNRSLTVTAP